jgi:hypothetical protein
MPGSCIATYSAFDYLNAQARRITSIPKGYRVNSMSESEFRRNNPCQGEARRKWLRHFLAYQKLIPVAALFLLKLFLSSDLGSVPHITKPLRRETGQDFLQKLEHVILGERIKIEGSGHRYALPFLHLEIVEYVLPDYLTKPKDITEWFYIAHGLGADFQNKRTQEIQEKITGDAGGRLRLLRFYVLSEGNLGKRRVPELFQKGLIFLN